MNIYFIKAFTKRLFTSFVTLFLLVSFVFVLVRISPGDPVQKFISPEFSPELSQKILSEFNLDQPITTQYISFVGNVFTGDFGTSYNFHQPVFTVVWQYLSFTIVFATISLAFQLIIAFYLSLKSIKFSRTPLEKFLDYVSLLVYATPSFVLGVFLIYLFSVQFNLFPTSGLTSLDFDSFSFWGKFADYLWHLFLPLITLSAAGIAMFYRYLKDNLEEVNQHGFITYLRSMGVSESIILRKHLLPNAVRPLISVAGIEFGILLGGALITEVLFSLPGMGRLMIDSIFARDYPLVVGCSLASAALMILSNIIADIIKMRLDKRLIKGLIR